MFDRACALVGMVHLRPLPGSPRWDGDLTHVFEAAMEDAEALAAGGCDALLVENMWDAPYLRGTVPPEIVAAMTRATAMVAEVGLPVGVQVLAGANREALGVAIGAQAQFIRVEGFAYAHVADEGWIEASAGPLLRARNALGAKVEIWADVQKKHSAHAVTGDLSLSELAHGHAFCGADALIVTGAATGKSTRLGDVQAAKTAGLPVVVGSGVTDQDAATLAGVADALIVGSWLKVDGDWRKPVEVARVRAMRAAVDAGILGR